MKKFLPLLLAFNFSSCALITTPVKVAGAAASTTIKTSGKIIGAGADALSKNKDSEPKD